MELKEIKWLEYLKKAKDFITIEPLVICWLLPAIFNQVAMENLELEKSCRVNLNMGKEVCDLMINRPEDLDCSVFAVETSTVADQLLSYNDTLLETATNLTMKAADILIDDPKVALHKLVCVAEEESQKLLARIKGIRGPISAIFPLIIVLFAGGYSDKHNLRKPCMILPVIGDLMAVIVLLIASIFMYQLPMEFSGYLEKIFPAITGNFTLMIMGIFSYLTAISKEEDRTFRFGLFSAMVSVIPTLSFLAGPLYYALGYVKLFLLSIVIYVIGLLYAIFWLKEIKVPVTSEEDQAAAEATGSEVARTNGNGSGMDNMGFQDAPPPSSSDNAEDKDKNGQSNGNHRKDGDAADDVPVKRNFCREFFDPTLALACIQVVRKKRDHLKHIIIWLLIVSYIIIAGTAQGEVEYLYQFTRLQLNWNGVDLSYFVTFTTVLALIGTLLMVSVFSKYFKITDPMIGIIASVLSIISKPVLAFSRTTLAYYIGSLFDVFVSTRTIALRSISSTCVHPDEINRLYAVFGVMEAFSGFIFPPMYSLVYIDTLKTFPGTIYFLSTGFFVVTVACFLFIYINNKRKSVQEANKQKETENAEPTVVETAHL